MLKLDDRDFAILRVLGKEGRLSKTELAKRVNLSASPCWERLKRLEDAGIIRGYHADIELKKITPHVVVFVVVELENHRAENFQIFEQALDRCDEVTACWALGGGFDYLMQVVAGDSGGCRSSGPANSIARVSVHCPEDRDGFAHPGLDHTDCNPDQCFGG